MTDHIGIVGSGSIGSLLAAHLTLSGRRVTVVDGWYPHVEEVRDHGLEIQAPDEHVHVRLNAFNLDELDRVAGRIDVLLVAVKAYESAMAVRLMGPLLTADCIVVPVQNGMTDQMFTGLVPADRLLGCSVHVPAELTAPGRVTRYVARDRRTFSVGEPGGGITARAEWLAEMFGAAGRTELADDLMGTKWAKLAVNMMANAPAGITGWTTHRLWSDPASVPLVIRAAGETLAVAEASGAHAGLVFGRYDPALFRSALHDTAAAHDAAAALMEIARERTGPSESRPSLLQDVDRGRRTEVRYLNGFVVERGREVGVPTPVNSGLLTLVEEIDRRRLRPDPANLERLREQALGKVLSRPPQPEHRARVAAPELERWVADILVRCAVQRDHAESSARALVAADLQGIDSHGVARLPAYIRRLRTGATGTQGEPQVLRSEGPTALVDGQNLMGHPVSELAMKTAIDRARTHGVGWVAVRRSNHFGIAGYYARMAAEQGLVGLSGTNAGPRVAPAGANRPFLGTNPLAVAVPTEEPPMLVVDMATSAVSTGKLEIASRAGVPIPEGWGVDQDGDPTTDAAALAAGGWLLPLGSFRRLSDHKGFALGLVVEVLSGLLGGGPYGPGVQNLVHTAGDQPARIGHFFAAIDPSRFGDSQAFTAAVSAMLADLHDLPPRDPDQPVMTPGEPEWRCAQERTRDGIPVQGEVLRALLGIADEHALALPTL